MSLLGPESRGSKRRRSVAQVRLDMLRTARELIEQEGLTVSLQHISLDAIAAIAGISRSSVYRAFPDREVFFAELLVELARNRRAGPDAFDVRAIDAALGALTDLMDEQPDILSTADGRRSVLVEVSRRGATANFEELIGSNFWRSYVVLSATALSYADPMRSRLRDAIEAGSHIHRTAMGAFYECLGELLGRRMRAEFAEPDATGNGPFYQAARTGSAVIQGLVLSEANGSFGSESTPEAATIATGHPSDPFDTGRKENWTLPALTFTAMFLSMSEPDPDYVFDADRVHGMLPTVLDYVREKVAAIDTRRTTTATGSTDDKGGNV